MHRVAAGTDGDDLRILLAVLGRGSLLAAASELSLAVSTVSRRIGRLESRVGQMLIERRSDGALPTPSVRPRAGHRGRTRRAGLGRTLRQPARDTKALRGVLRISVGDGFTGWLAQCTAALSAQQPALDSRLWQVRASSAACLFVEHDMEIVERYAERALAFYDGRIRADGPVAEVLAHEDVRRYVIGTELHRRSPREEPA